MPGYPMKGKELSTVGGLLGGDQAQVDRLKYLGGLLGSVVTDPYYQFGDANRALIQSAIQGKKATPEEIDNMANATADSMGETGEIASHMATPRIKEAALQAAGSIVAKTALDDQTLRAVLGRFGLLQ